MQTIVQRVRFILADHRFQRMDWRSVLGKRLKELRKQAHGGKGYAQKEVARVIGKTPAYINRLENKMADCNPSLELLDKLCSLYGVPIGELFVVLIRDHGNLNIQLKAKLDFILSSPAKKTAIGIEENILAMYERVLALGQKPEE